MSSIKQKDLHILAAGCAPCVAWQAVQAAPRLRTTTSRVVGGHRPFKRHAAPLCIGRSSGMRVHRPFKRHARHQGAHFQLAGRSSGACLIRLAAGTWHVLACRGVQRASCLHLASGDLLRGCFAFCFVPAQASPVRTGAVLFRFVASFHCMPAPFTRGLFYSLRSVGASPARAGTVLVACGSPARAGTFWMRCARTFHSCQPAPRGRCYFTLLRVRTF